MSFAERLFCLQKLITWLNNQSQNPKSRTNLQALNSGLIADQLVTCDNTENIRRIIQQSVDNVALSDTSIKRSQQTMTLASLKQL